MMPFEPPPIREHVPSRILTTVHKKHYPGIFGRFEDVIASRIAYLKRRDRELDAEKIRFFEWLLNHVDHAEFGAMQEDFLAADALDFEYLKFLDPIGWFEDKVTTANQIGLNEHAPGSVLDLGTGAGHFIVVAEFYGHKGLGTEVIDYGRDDPDDDPAYREFQRQRLFTRCCRVYGVERINHAVKAFGDLDGLPAGNDWVTGFGVYFDSAPDWSLAAWRHFLENAGHLLKDDGSVFLTLITSRLPEADWQYLRKLSRNDQLGRPWIDAVTLRNLPPVA